MTLGQHLVELRKRLMISALAIVVAMIAAFFLAEQVIQLLSVPIAMIAEQRGTEFAKLNFTSITAGFDLRLRIAFAIGLIASAPVWIWQIWAFLMPGLTRKEIRYTVGFLAAAIPLFFAGTAVGWLVMPHIIELMAQFVPAQGALFFDAQYYYDFILKLLLVVGVAFVLPVFLVALNFAGVISGIAILKGWRIAVLVSVIFAGLATPAADIFSMLMLAGILIVLYIAAAGISLLVDRRRNKRNETLLETTTP
ncbi:twin-arginine translocase subunit TatC [Microbacterium sp. cx-55]|uniref:twin-arginine translocase subunit TatC n=1 Tax=Microbacterium sp. cx-55 TaxID=2875948 RepID=UPI001CBB5BD9|nr:twin-arginine translocase subunit TatC [Microbacterium sp. cx-55]MBZ4486455.1 twin-arginine translocase subunit TatC [Microbacterium sp. cx-55]UGB36689.1 twin-arginine translocase subunit TatC [Microbacterium sp. cx-55]